MFRTVLSRVQRTVFRTASTPEQREVAATAVRRGRVDAVHALWSEISRLQHEIKDVSDTRDSAVTENERAAVGDRLAALEADLARTQRELSGLQGRV